MHTVTKRGVACVFRAKNQRRFKTTTKEGAYITISNHPLGGIDGVFLLKLMLEETFQNYS
jgi:hypothetical protein